MGKEVKIDAEQDRRKAELIRIGGSIPWMKRRDKRYLKAKVFKSGNSLALRVPAGTDLVAGMEMNLIIEDGLFLSYEPVEAPKRKFNIEKVAGSATNLEFIKDEDRVFEHRPLLWDEASDDHEA